MKKALKITLHVASVIVLAIIVFTGSFVTKFTNNDESRSDKKKSSDGLFAAFTVDRAFADAPTGGEGCEEYCGGGCSGDGDDDGDGAGSDGSGNY